MRFKINEYYEIISDKHGYLFRDLREQSKVKGKDNSLYNTPTLTMLINSIRHYFIRTYESEHIDEAISKADQAIEIMLNNNPNVLEILKDERNDYYQ